MLRNPAPGNRHRWFIPKFIIGFLPSQVVQDQPGSLTGALQWTRSEGRGVGQWIASPGTGTGLPLPCNPSPGLPYIYIYSYITYQYITCHNQLWPLWESPKQPAVTAVTPMSDERRMRIWQRSGKSQMRSLTARDDDEKKCSEVRIVGPE